MPAIASGKVLVTGANGYIALWIVKLLLEAGYSVRGTIRSESKAGYLRKLFASYGDKLELVIVEDITKEEAFAECVKGVDAIAHTASPFHMNAVEPEKLITPAVEGTLSVLKAAAAHGASVKRFIVLSSCAAVLRESAPFGAVLDESSWNEDSIEKVRAQGRDAPNGDKYLASKTLAERAAWEWYEEHKSSVGFDVVSLNPPYVFGPFLHECSQPEHLNTSAYVWWNNVVRPQLDVDALANQSVLWVNVRDIAEAHVRALQRPKAGGSRYIIAAGASKWQDFVDAAHAAFPSKIAAGNTSYEPAKAKHRMYYNVTRSQQVLGMKYRTFEETAVDTVKDFEARSWL